MQLTVSMIIKVMEFPQHATTHQLFCLRVNRLMLRLRVLLCS